MDYEDFKDKFIADVKDKLEDAGIDTSIKVNMVNKLNESYEAMTVTPEGSNIGLNLSIDKFYDAYNDGVTFENAVDKAVDSIMKGIDNTPSFNLSALTDYEQMKDKLITEVVSIDANKEKLETVPHKDIEDMAVVYRFVLSSDETGRSSVLVTNQMLENMGITPEQLHNHAIENAPLINPLEIRGMSEVMAELMGIEEAKMLGIVPMDPKDEQLFVASVPDKIHGAGILAYQDFMDKAAERAGGDFFILPSSIHELLIVPDNGRMELNELESMVRSVNKNQVAPQDKLTDNVYHYDSKEKIFELGEKFVERQAQKDESLTEEKAIEKEEKEIRKASVLSDLKAKKEEVAKAPKKEHIEKGTKSRGAEL